MTTKEELQHHADPEYLKTVTLYRMAVIIKRDWKKVNYAAEPYLAAMATLNSIDYDYGHDSGKSIVLYFLSNAKSWRGEVARAVKKELKRRCK